MSKCSLKSFDYNNLPTILNIELFNNKFSSRVYLNVFLSKNLASVLIS